MTNTYTDGWNAYYDNIEADENPHYKSSGDLPQDYYDWNKGWNEAEDSWYRKLDDDESANWQECLSEAE